MTRHTFQIDAYQKAGELLLPAFELPLEKGKIIGLYIDPAKSSYLLKVYSTFQKIDLYRKEDALYDRLTVKQLIHFYLKIYQSTKTLREIINLFNLQAHMHTKIKTLDVNVKRKLHIVKIYISPYPCAVLEEPFQNIESKMRTFLIRMLQHCSHKMIVILSNNLENLVDCSQVIYRIDQHGLNPLDITQDELPLTEPSQQRKEIQIEKIPTRKDGKIVLFNPPEIDYIESLAGEILVYVSGIAYPCPLTLKELENRLAPLGFFRSHRSYIVNLQKVREIVTWTRNSYSLTIDSTEEAVVPLSKNNYPILKKMIGI